MEIPITAGCKIRKCWIRNLASSLLENSTLIKYWNYFELCIEVGTQKDTIQSKQLSISCPRLSDTFGCPSLS